jgi:hypothetical protein
MCKLAPPHGSQPGKGNPNPSQEVHQLGDAQHSAGNHTYHFPFTFYCVLHIHYLSLNPKNKK